MVVTPVIEQILPDSPASRIPHTVTLVSIPACSDGKRGFSVSIDQGCGTEHPRTVRVRECVPVPSALPRARASHAPSAPGIHPRDLLEEEGWGWVVPIIQGWPVGTVVACPCLQGGLWGLCWCVLGHPGIASYAKVGCGYHTCPCVVGVACGDCASMFLSRREGDNGSDTPIGSVQAHAPDGDSVGGLTPLSPQGGPRLHQP